MKVSNPTALWKGPGLGHVTYAIDPGVCGRGQQLHAGTAGQGCNNENKHGAVRSKRPTLPLTSCATLCSVCRRCSDSSTRAAQPCSAVRMMARSRCMRAAFERFLRTLLALRACTSRHRSLRYCLLQLPASGQQRMEQACAAGSEPAMQRHRAQSAPVSYDQRLPFIHPGRALHRCNHASGCPLWRPRALPGHTGPTHPPTHPPTHLSSSSAFSMSRSARSER